MIHAPAGSPAVRKILTVGCLLLLCATSSIGGGPVPVLCYHRFSDDSVHTAGALTSTYTKFEAMLMVLAGKGYVSCFPDEVQSGACEAGKRIIITLDDGTRDQLRAADLLQHYGYTAVFFVIPQRILERSDRYLSPAELNTLARRGNRIAVHGFNHERMPESAEEVTASCERSPGILQQIVPIGQPL
jgi:peptidoglycan/xylan/chitin deacetylase (PgdA/CDA1 family)